LWSRICVSSFADRAYGSNRFDVSKKQI